MPDKEFEFRTTLNGASRRFIKFYSKNGRHIILSFATNDWYEENIVNIFLSYLQVI